MRKARKYFYGICCLPEGDEDKIDDNLENCFGN